MLYCLGFQLFILARKVPDDFNVSSSCLNLNMFLMERSEFGFIFPHFINYFSLFSCLSLASGNRNMAKKGGQQMCGMKK